MCQNYFKCFPHNNLFNPHNNFHFTDKEIDAQ